MCMLAVLNNRLWIKFSHLRPIPVTYNKKTKKC